MPNGLRLWRIKTKAEKIPVNISIDEFLSNHFKDNGYIIAYLYNEVRLGYYRDGKYIFYDGMPIEEKYLIRLRLFNHSKELHIWRDSQGLQARLRIDGEGNECTVVDACQVLWGTMAESLGEFSRLREERGTTLIVPLKDLKVDDRKKRLFIKTRNYVGYTPALQATYIDCRFIEFTDSFIKDEEA